MEKNKKILVTGADGFIGSSLVERLIDDGCDIRALVYYNSFNSWGWLDAFPKEKLKKIEVFPGDVRDYNSVKNAVKGCSYIFHLAALIAIPYSYQSPDSYVDANIKGTLNILQSAKSAAVEKTIITSTSEVYGSAKYIPIDEKHPFQGQSPYSATKIGADRLTESFIKSFGLPATIARPFNTYGPRQSARAIIPTIITQLLTGRNEIRLGNLEPTRDFVYVKDTVRGLISLMESNEATGREVNIASNTEISIGELAEKIISIINPSANIISDSNRFRPDNSEVDRLKGDNSLICGLTDWRIEYDFDKGLKETIEWFSIKENLAKYKPDLYNL